MVVFDGCGILPVRGEASWGRGARGGARWPCWDGVGGRLLAALSLPRISQFTPQGRTGGGLWGCPGSRLDRTSSAAGGGLLIGWGEGGHRVGGEGLGGFASNKDAQVSYMHNTAPGVGSRRSLGKDTVQWRDVISKKSQEQQGCKSLFYPCCWRTRAVSSGPCALGLADGGSSR